MTRRESCDKLAVVILNLLFKIKKKRKRAIELIIANKELLFQNEEKEKRARTCCYNKELAFQNEEKKNNK
jgi:hypothetical protein